MGFIDPLTPAQQAQIVMPFPFIFNVTNAVGRSCPNKSDDVKLIHFFLIEIYKTPGIRFNWQKPKGEIDFESGVYSAATENWITKAQIDINRNFSPPVLLDSRVDRIRNKDFFYGSITNTFYTLAWFNMLLSLENPLRFISLPLSVSVVVGNVPPPSWDVVRNAR